LPASVLAHDNRFLDA